MVCLSTGYVESDYCHWELREFALRMTRERIAFDMGQTEKLKSQIVYVDVPGIVPNHSEVLRDQYLWRTAGELTSLPIREPASIWDIPGLNANHQKWLNTTKEAPGMPIHHRITLRNYERFKKFRYLGDLEVNRVLKNAGLNPAIAASYFAEFVLVAVTDDLIDDAIAIDEPLGGADSLHIATALKIGTAAVRVVTHDKQMARAAMRLGFEVLDPVTDDPIRDPIS